jgi:hypothetical protein
VATLNPTSSFQSWVLTEVEHIQGSILSLLHKQCIQNQICQLAEERIALSIDPSNPLPFIQKDAELKGSILALQYLITLSNSAEEQAVRPTNPQEL